MAQVCRRFRDTVANSVELQYCIELAADGLVDGTDCPLSTAERLERLLQLRLRWRHLDWTRVTHIRTPSTFRADEIVDGIHAMVVPSKNHRLTLTWLPTDADSQSRTIEREYVGLVVHDFAMDPSQDLIALVVTVQDADTQLQWYVRG